MDRSGRELSAWMEVKRGTGGSPVNSEEDLGRDAQATIRLCVDAAGAQFPITVDPLATSAAWTAESDQASAQFGLSVSTAGDVNG
ncbi:MAG: hypothetical protein HYZ00_09905, partial [Candidatus Hydrogenedentes bacterium]|nr:hypothetical protein [Candidatus Hydrogenedentota bacterium]